MATEISICSNALLKLGAPTISSFTDNLPQASLASNLWQSTRDAVLRDHPWNCCTRRLVLSPEVSTPAWGYSAQFVIPGDCLRIVEVEDNLDYRVEGGRILTDDSIVNLKYIFRNIDVSSYDAMLIDALTQRMCAEMCYAITKSAAQQTLELQKYTAILKVARNVDTSEKPTENFISYPALEVRYF